MEYQHWQWAALLLQYMMAEQSVKENIKNYKMTNLFADVYHVASCKL
jgi:hypothetical protein